MDSRLICKGLRKEFSKCGWALLIYYQIMSVAVMAFIFLDLLARLLPGLITDPDFSLSILEDEAVLSRLLGNGWGYIAACILGAVLMLLWKKKEFCLKVIWQHDKPMTGKAFLTLLCVFLSGQAVFQIVTPLLEWAFQLMGISLSESTEAATQIPDTFSMFLYAGIFAPVFEEVFFRGLILRSLMPYGKKFAILASAFLFGVFHGNVVQSPFAFVVGLVLGYAAAEYSIIWAMVLHVINNLVLGDLFSRMQIWVPEHILQLSFDVIVWGCTIVSMILAAVYAPKIGEYLRTKRIHPYSLRSFFTSPGILVFTGYMVMNTVFALVLQSL